MAFSLVDGSLWWLAVIMAVLGNLIDAIAYLLEKKSHIRIQNDLKEQGDADGDRKEESVSYLKSCRWWFGFATHIVGASLFSLSLGLGDQALLSPLQSITIVFNTILSWKYLNEKLNSMQIIGTTMIIAGCALVIAFGPKSQRNVHTAQTLKTLFQTANFLIFAGIIILIAMIDYIIIKFFKSSQLYKNETFLLFSFVGQAAFHGSWNVLFTKCFVEILTSSTEKGTNNAINNWSSYYYSYITYISLALLIFTMITLEYWRQESLKNFPANYVGAMYTILVIIGGICFAAMFFNEFVDMNIIYIFIFCLAVLISFIGVGLLAFGDKYGQHKKHIDTMIIDDKYKNILTDIEMDDNHELNRSGSQFNSGDISINSRDPEISQVLT